MVERSSPSVKVTRYDLLCLLSLQTGADYSLVTTFPFLRGTPQAFIAVAELVSHTGKFLFLFFFPPQRIYLFV